MAEMRKYCATTITQNSKNGQISTSRLQDSGGNSGDTGRNLEIKNGVGTSGSNTAKTNLNNRINRHY
jgi:hypothetical protein